MKTELKSRTKRVGLAIIVMIDELPNKPSSWVITKQIIRSSTSIGANYRAACRAKSSSDYINKLKIVEEETDETIYWLEILEEANMLLPERIQHIKKETNEILAIMVSTIKTMREKK